MEKAFQDFKKMVSTKQAGEMYAHSPGTLANWRTLKKGPRYFKRGHKVLYRLEDLEKFFTECPVLTTDSLEARG